MDLKEQEVFQSSIRHPWELARAKSILELIEQYTADTNIFLDYGCGDLFFIQKAMSTFSTKKAVAYDIGFSEKDVSLLEEKHPKIKIINHQTGLEESLNNEVVDVVFLMDVLEHIEDDRGILEFIIDQEWFGQSSSLVITVPAYQSLFTSHDIFLDHYRRYTNSSLKKVVEVAGFKAVEYGYFFSSLVLPRAWSKMKEMVTKTKDKEIESELTSWKGSTFTTDFITKTLYLDFRMNLFLNRTLHIRPPGLSNYMVCQKSA